MWYVSNIVYHGERSAVVNIENDFQIEIKNIETNECRRGHYYEFSHLDVVGYFCTDDKFYAGVVNPIGLKLVDYIEDVRIIRSIPATAVRPSINIVPLTDLYCKTGKFGFDSRIRECIFITDIIWEIFDKYNFKKEYLDLIKRKKAFYIDCWACGNKYKVTVTNRFLTQITRMKTLLT